MNVHPLTNKPTAAWDELSKTQKMVKIKAKIPNNPVAHDKVRIVCMSDTHSLTSHIRFDIPEGDIFIHAGDFSRCGQLEEVVEFNEWLGEICGKRIISLLIFDEKYDATFRKHSFISRTATLYFSIFLNRNGKLPHKHKIVIAGNHELSFDHSFTHPLSPRTPHSEFQHVNSIPTFGIPKDNIVKAVSCVNAKSHLTNCIYLQDSEVVLYGIKFYGSPWQPEFHKWAFNLPRGISCLKKWDLIPDDTDVLITHTPPLGHGDFCCTGVRAGCVELLTTIQQRVKPKYHIFGHIHEGYGITSDGKTIFINASTCDILYTPMNLPIVFDISLPSGVQKS